MNDYSNLENQNNLPDNKICIICLENENDIENNKLIEYNHCGIYYIHNSCLNAWIHPECLICRKKMYLMHDDSQSNISDVVNIISDINNLNNNSPIVLISNNNQRYTITTQYDYFCFYKVVFAIYIIGIFTMLGYNYFF